MSSITPPCTTRIGAAPGPDRATIWACADASRPFVEPKIEATDAEVAAAALQFVRKVSGYRVPSRKNAEAFDGAVAEIAAASKRLLE